MILAPPCDTAFGCDRGIERPEHDILVLEFFQLLRHESNTQSRGYCVNHGSFKIDILQNLWGKTLARARLEKPLTITRITRFGHPDEEHWRESLQIDRR